MKLLCTTVIDGSAFAVYVASGIDRASVYAQVAMLMNGHNGVFGPGVRLVQVSDEPAPAMLPPDLSESLHDQARG